MGATLKLWVKAGGLYPNQWSGCEGSCFLQVPGIGFAIDCDDVTGQPIDNGQELATAFENGHNASANLFLIDFNTIYSNGTGLALTDLFSSAVSSSYLEMNVSYPNATMGDAGLSCPGTMTSQTCRLWPAVVKFPVRIQNSSSAFTVSIGAQNPSNVSMDTQNLGAFNGTGYQQDGFEVLRQIPILKSHVTATDNINSSLSGIQLGFMMYIRSRSTLTWDNSLDSSFIIDQMSHAANFMSESPMDPRSCAFKYNDPLKPYHAPNGLFQLSSMIGQINQIMFGLSTSVSRDNPSNNYSQTMQFNAVQHKETIHYISHFPYMWGTIAATVVCFIFVLPVYYGFWELGRKVTLNPFEIAHAFRSPVINQASTAATDELIQVVGGRQIRYGNIIAGDGRGRFGVDEPQNVA